MLVEITKNKRRRRKEEKLLEDTPPFFSFPMKGCVIFMRKNKIACITSTAVSHLVSHRYILDQSLRNLFLKKILHFA